MLISAGADVNAQINVEVDIEIDLNSEHIDDIDVYNELLESISTTSTLTKLTGTNSTISTKIFKEKQKKPTIKDGKLIIRPQLKGYTPLHLALKKGANKEIVNELITSGANVNKADKDNNTPLHLALVNGADIEIIKILLNAGADIAVKNNFGYTPLTITLEKDVEKSKILIKAIDNSNTSQEFLDESLNSALFYNLDIEIINSLISAGANVNAKVGIIGDSQLVTALKFLPRNIKPTREYTSKEVEFNELLNKNLPKPGKSSFEEAVNKSTKNSLASEDTKPDFDHAEVINTLIKAGANFNEKIPYYGTLLHYVASSHRVGKEITTIILAANPDNINAFNDRGNTPLHEIAYDLSKNYKTKVKDVRSKIKLLLDNGADPSLRSFYGATASGISPEVKKIIDDYNEEKQLGNDLIIIYSLDGVKKPENYERTVVGASKSNEENRTAKKEIPFSTFVAAMKNVVTTYYGKKITHTPEKPNSEKRDRVHLTKTTDRKSKNRSIN